MQEEAARQRDHEGELEAADDPPERAIVREEAPAGALELAEGGQDDEAEGGEADDPGLRGELEVEVVAAARPGADLAADDPGVSFVGVGGHARAGAEDRVFEEEKTRRLHLGEASADGTVGVADAGGLEPDRLRDRRADGKDALGVVRHRRDHDEADEPGEDELPPAQHADREGDGDGQPQRDDHAAGEGEGHARGDQRDRGPRRHPGEAPGREREPRPDREEHGHDLGEPVRLPDRTGEPDRHAALPVDDRRVELAEAREGPLRGTERLLETGDRAHHGAGGHDRERGRTHLVPRTDRVRDQQREEHAFERPGLDLIEGFIKTVAGWIRERAQPEIEFLTKNIEETLPERYTNAIDKPFARITYTDAIELLRENKDRFENEPVWGEDLATEHEKFLTEEHFQQLVFVTDWPTIIKPFYMRRNDDGKTVACVDLIAPGAGELVGGSQREERYDLLQERAKEMGLEEADYSWYIETRRWGSAPHSGFGIGLERFLLYMTGMKNIRDLLPFPRTRGSV